MHFNKVAHITTIDRVAKDLGESVDWLYDVANEMDVEDGVIWVYGLGDDGIMAFTDSGIENLVELIKRSAETRRRARSAETRRDQRPCGPRRMLPNRACVGPTLTQFSCAFVSIARGPRAARTFAIATSGSSPSSTNKRAEIIPARPKPPLQ